MKSKKSQLCKAKKFAKDEQGGILIIFGLSVVFLVAMGGAAVDLGLQQLMQVKLQNSVDSAVTSAGSLSSCMQEMTESVREDAARRYFRLNYPANFLSYPGKSYTDGTRPRLDVRFQNDNIYGNARDDVGTHFVSNFGTKKLNGEANSGASVTDAFLDRDFDLVFVVDESGSMVGRAQAAAYNPNPDFSGNTPPTAYPPFIQSRAAAARESFRVFIKNIMPDCTVRNPNVRVGFVGFTGYISNKWSLTDSRNDALLMPQNIFPKGRNIEEIGLRAGLNMLMGVQDGPFGPAVNRGSGSYAPGWYYPGEKCINGTPFTDDYNIGCDSVTPTLIRNYWNDNQPHAEDRGYAHGYEVSPMNPNANERRGRVYPDSTNIQGNRWFRIGLAGNQGYVGDGSGPAGKVSEGFDDLSVDFDVRMPLPQTNRTPNRLTPAQRYLVFMSDGSVATDSSSGPFDPTAMLSECENVKSQPGKTYGANRLFTINFASTNPNDANNLTTCASTNPETGQKDYAFADNEAALKSILENIVKNVRKTRIVE